LKPKTKKIPEERIRRKIFFSGRKTFFHVPDVPNVPPGSHSSLTEALPKAAINCHYMKVHKMISLVETAAYKVLSERGAFSNLFDCFLKSLIKQ
jgi:hypothetical protein